MAEPVESGFLNSRTSWSLGRVAERGYTTVSGLRGYRRDEVVAALIEKVDEVDAAVMMIANNPE